MNRAPVSIVAAGIGVLLGAWQTQAHLRGPQRGGARRLRGLQVKAAADVAYLRGRQNERDRGRENQ